eukprot:TRINITY_DN11110_c0_g1_i1.p1 TRINITY_DN11110_c0_g1~~TRINITY_DN11110_c0_g1_i1.p1  ORF type:complete len:220 (-),score=23.02 TRINITY_DN11110_c0_g1_i1:260-919(-)
MQCLSEAGYVAKSRILHAEGWIPQKRDRVYIVGVRKDLAESAFAAFRWPEPPGGGVVQDVLEASHSAEARKCELTEVQWEAVQKSSTWKSGGQQLRFVNVKGVAATLTSSYRSSYATTAEMVSPGDSGLDRPRFFTRRECARLMGFPEEQDFGNPHSANRAYRQLGNAVCPPLISAIAKCLLQSLGTLMTPEHHLDRPRKEKWAGGELDHAGGEKCRRL